MILCWLQLYNSCYLISEPCSLAYSTFVQPSDKTWWKSCIVSLMFCLAFFFSFVPFLLSGIEIFSDSSYALFVVYQLYPYCLCVVIFVAYLLYFTVLIYMVLSILSCLLLCFPSSIWYFGSGNLWCIDSLFCFSSSILYWGSGHLCCYASSVWYWGSCHICCLVSLICFASFCTELSILLSLTSLFCFASPVCIEDFIIFIALLPDFDFLHLFAILDLVIFVT